MNKSCFTFHAILDVRFSILAGDFFQASAAIKAEVSFCMNLNSPKSSEVFYMLRAVPLMPTCF